VVVSQEDEEDMVKYRPWEAVENAGFDEEEDEEVEMTERSMKLLVSTNDNNSAKF